MKLIVLVTGAAGFVGSHLLQLLTATPSPPRIVAWRRPVTPSRAPTTRAPRTYGDESIIEWSDVDVLDRNQVANGLDAVRPAVIYHLAGAAGVHASWNRTEANVGGTSHLLAAASTIRPRPRILIPGSALVYRPTGARIRETDPLGPVSPYALSKLAQELLALQYVDDGLDIVLTRSFTHLGPGQDPAYAAASFAHQIARIEAGLEEPVLRVGALEAERDFTDVRDTVRAYRLLMERGTTGHPYNVCSGNACKVGEIVERLVDLATVQINIEADVARLRPNDNLKLVGDPTRLKTETGWTPLITLDSSLRDLLNYSRAFV